MMRSANPRLAVWLIAAAVLQAGAQAQDPQAEPALVPPAFRLHDAAGEALAAAWLTEDELHAMRVFHGVWDQRDLTTPLLRATVALNAWDLSNPVFDDPAVPVELRAEAALLSGEFQRAIELLEGAQTNHAARIRAEAHEGLGALDQAYRATRPAVERLLKTTIADPVELTEGVRALFVAARVEGQPARDFQTMMNLLARAHQQLDRLYWPSRLAEAELLLDKDNMIEAVGALHESLALNPRCAHGWFLLGNAALDRFDFDGAVRAAESLQRINPEHPLSAMLLAEARLVQDDPEGALELLDPLLKRFPKLRPALALKAAALAITYDQAAMQAALNEFDALSPNSALAHFAVGRHLSFNRQYAEAATALEEAVKRQPAWPAPQIELGLLELQSGRESNALAALKKVATLDPFNKRAANSLFLLEELAGYEQIETEHFLIRYRPGPDQAMAEMMPPVLERIHATVSGRFKFEPDRKTIIELMPDHERFSVRITGMPFVETVAACTGPVIALETPREGPPSKHLGLFDWPRVIQHEYTHTITLAQTANRIPHWLTEAAAVSMEMAPRSYETCRMLADSLRENTLFDLDQIKWAFVRPRKPGDRGKAYAQGHWMVQYMDQRFGEDAIVRLLGRYFEGRREQQAMTEALGVTREEFFAGFLEWARAETASWGLAAEPSLADLTDELRWADEALASVMRASQQARLETIVKGLTEQIGAPGSGASKSVSGGGRQITAADWPDLVRPPVEITDATLAQWLSLYPDHPDLVEEHLRRRIRAAGPEGAGGAGVGGGEPDESLIAELERYATLRPVDPFPHKKLADIHLKSDEPHRAIPHLQELDIREEKTSVFAVRLAELHRQQGDVDTAWAKVTRAVHMNPYHAPNRELAAAIALEARDHYAARMHIAALTILEPDRPQHARRLEAIEKLIEQGSGSNAGPP